MRNGARRSVNVKELAEIAGAFALGATAGSIIATLCAPASGRVTRQRLLRRIQTVERTALRQIGRTRQRLVTQATQARRWVLQHVANGNGRRTIRRAVQHA